MCWETSLNGIFRLFDNFDLHAKISFVCSTDLIFFKNFVQISKISEISMDNGSWSFPNGVYY